MPRYRPIDVEKRIDDKYLSLSKPAPNARTLFDYFLECGHDRSIPGLLVVGLGQVSDELEWSKEEVLKVWSEIEKAGMAKADWRARVVWLPGAIKRRAFPRNRKIIKGWGKYWSEVPNCLLKLEAHIAMTQFLSGVNGTDAWPTRAQDCSEAFQKACARPLVADMTKEELLLKVRESDNIFVSHTNQIQDRTKEKDNDKEKDKENDLPLISPSVEPKAKRKKKSEARVVDPALAHRAQEILDEWNRVTAETRLPAQAKFGERPSRDKDLIALLKDKPHRDVGWWRIVFADIAVDPKSFETHGWRPMLHLIIQSEEKLRERFDQALANRRRVTAPDARPKTPTAAERTFDAVRELLDEANARERGEQSETDLLRFPEFTEAT